MLRTIKNNLMMVAAIVALSSAVAFTAPAKQTETISWFVFNGGALNNPSNYTKIGSAPTECNSEGARCAIQAEEQVGAELPIAAHTTAPLAEVKYDE